MKESIMNFLNDVTYENFHLKGKDFVNLIFSLYKSGIEKKTLTDYLAELYLDDKLDGYQQDVAGDFLNKIGGHCSKQDRLEWPK